MSNAFEMALTLTRRQRQALQILAKAERPLRNKDFHEKAETDGHRTTGWAKALGPCTKPRDRDPASLWAQGLVTVADSCFYTITTRGREVANAMGFAGIPAKLRCQRDSAGTRPTIGPSMPLARPEQVRKSTSASECSHDESSSPCPELISNLKLDP